MFPGLVQGTCWKAGVRKVLSLLSSSRSLTVSVAVSAAGSDRPPAGGPGVEARSCELARASQQAPGQWVRAPRRMGAGPRTDGCGPPDDGAGPRTDGCGLPDGWVRASG